MPKTIKPAYNVARLKNSQQCNEFADDLDDRLIAHGPLTGCPTQQWEQFKSLVTESARATISPRKRIHQDWFDENDETIKSLLDNKQKTFIEWQSDPSSTSKYDRFKHLQRQAQTTLRKMQDKWWEDKAEEVQRYADTQNSKMFCSAIKEVYGPMKPCTAPFLTADGSTLLKEKRSINARWREHFCTLLNRSSTVESHALDLITQKPTVHCLDLPPTMEEAMKAISQTNSGKAPGMDGIPAEIFKSVSEDNLPEAQCGFRPNRSTADMIFTMRQVQEKCTEQNMDLYAVFIDLTKAFDTVNREALWVILSKLGCPDKFVNLIRQFHDNMTGQVLSVGEVSEPFNISNGVKQGCVLAPILFNMFFTCVLNHAFRDLDLWVYLRFRSGRSVFDLRRLNAKTKTTEKLILEALFADDCALMAHKESDLKLIFDKFAETARLFGLTISLGKTERKVRLSTKLKVYRAVVLTSVLYGCESWTLYRRHLKQLERFHMRSLRSILNIKWQNRVTKLEMLDRAEMASIRAMIIKSLLRWVGCVIRMDDHRLRKQLWYGELSSGKRNTGRPRKSFKDCVKTHLTYTNIPPKKLETEALDRPQWFSITLQAQTVFEDQRRENARKARARRKATSSQPPSNEHFPCPHCPRVCRSKIGLISPLRTHNGH
ncbi:uncharacterized protein LOC143022261 [Oratosquilla oratoria]|uniref:uncharacterized protein LOC143022261 n=1 Tax=Oratosquilla oratoria TaxID=337810 RepID=UPI003F76C849